MKTLRKYPVLQLGVIGCAGAVTAGLAFLFQARMASVPALRNASELKRSTGAAFSPPGTAGRPVYPLSVVPGGVRSGGEAAKAASDDAVVREHYRDLDVSKLRPRVLGNPLRRYVSYRRDGKVYWTRQPVTLRAGELVLASSDSRNVDDQCEIRGRCGNRLSVHARLPVIPAAASEPKEMDFELPVPPIVEAVLGEGPAAPGTTVPPYVGAEAWPMFPLAPNTAAGSLAMGKKHAGAQGAPLASWFGPAGGSVPLPSRPGTNAPSGPANSVLNSTFELNIPTDTGAPPVSPVTLLPASRPPLIQFTETVLLQPVPVPQPPSSSASLRTPARPVPVETASGELRTTVPKPPSGSPSGGNSGVPLQNNGPDLMENFAAPLLPPLTSPETSSPAGAIPEPATAGMVIAAISLIAFARTKSRTC